MTETHTYNPQPALVGSHDCVLVAVLDRIDCVRDLIIRAHNAQMRNIDEETSDLGRQLMELFADHAGGEDADAQIARARAIAGRLDAIGKLTPNP